MEEIFTPLTSIEVFELFKDAPHAFFLDSGMDRVRLGRYSFIGSDPFIVFKNWGKDIKITSGGTTRHLIGNPFPVLKELMSRYKMTSLPNLPPFLGGAVGYFGYDLGGHLEKLPSNSLDNLKIPDCFLGFYDSAVIFDHLQKRVFISATGFPEKHEKSARKKARQRLEEIREIITRPPKKENTGNTFLPENYQVDLMSNFSHEEYIKAIVKAKEYIAAGDIYQVNLSQRFTAPMPFSPLELYKYLRHINPAPFAAFLNVGEKIKIASASPERFLRISGKMVETRPIKGTRPRGKNDAQDKYLSQELLASEKDRAELVMIVDLERNDLGRVCEYGSVRVPELIALEAYPTVYHLVATVKGKLYRGKDHIDCLTACFPGGSITGAPKIRSIEIIDELEPHKRKIYTGSIGYLGFNEETDLNIVIRTMALVDGTAYFQAGGGIVADSDPEAEYEETLYKARALIDAVSFKIGP